MEGLCQKESLLFESPLCYLILGKVPLWASASVDIKWVWCMCVPYLGLVWGGKRWSLVACAWLTRSAQYRRKSGYGWSILPGLRSVTCLALELCRKPSCFTHRIGAELLRKGGGPVWEGTLLPACGGLESQMPGPSSIASRGWPQC